MNRAIPKHAWQPGQSGNPAGRPKGSKNKLGEAFIEALHDDWKEHGVDAIRRACEKDPVGYLKTVASVIPKDINFNSGDGDSSFEERLRGMSDQEAAEYCLAMVSELSSLAASFDGGGGKAN